MKKVERIPFEKMPKDKSMSFSLDEVFNPKPNSMQEFTNNWMDKVGADEYFKQLKAYHFKKLGWTK
jgi:hypothetical protein